MNLHVFNNTNHKFSEPFFDFIESNFNISEHFFVILGDYSKSKYKTRNNLFIINSGHIKEDKKQLMELLYKADKIFIHNFAFRMWVNFVFASHNQIMKKTYWIIWGGDLYHYKFREKSLKSEVNEFFRKKIIRNFRGIISLVDGDYKLAREWYGAKAEYYHSFYPNSVNYRYLDKIRNDKNNKDEVYIQIGNSADPSNKYEEVFEYLSKFSKEKIKVFCPLSYGDKEYAVKISEIGRTIFGDKFVPMMNFLGAKEYGEFLNSIDIAIFNHDRQQGLGNILSLLYLEKKVYIKNDITPWVYFKNMGISIFNTYDIMNSTFEELKKIESSEKEKNYMIIKKEFSEEKCFECWKRIFES